MGDVGAHAALLMWQHAVQPPPDVTRSDAEDDVQRLILASTATQVSTPPVAAPDVQTLQLARSDMPGLPQRVLQADLGRNAIRPDIIRVRDHRMWDRIGPVIPRPGPGQTREELGLPVAPAEPLSDTMVFEGATDNKRYFLPRYRIATQNVSGNPQYMLRVEKSPQHDWILRVELERFRAPEIAADAAPEELVHEFGVRLSYRIAVAGGGTMQKELGFTELGRREDGLLFAILRLATPAARDQVLYAISDMDAATALIVTRTVRVAVAAAAGPDPAALQWFTISATITPDSVGGERRNIVEAQSPAVALFIDGNGRLIGSVNTPQGWIGVDSGPTLVSAGTTTHVTFTRDGAGLMQLTINGAIVGTRQVPGPIPSVGALGFLIGTWVDGQRYPFLGTIANVQVRESPGGPLLLAQGAGRSIQPVQGSRFRPVTRGLDSIADPHPLFLNLQANRYVFEGDAPTGTVGPGLIPRLAAYWQDAADPRLFYFLPDEFRLARRPSSPFYPLMSVKVAPGAQSMDAVSMTIEFVATPFVDPARLDAARRELAKFVSTSPGGPALAAADSGIDASTLATTAAQLRFEPLPVQRARLFLALPRAGVTSSGFVERPDAQINVDSALFCAETMPLADFQAVYDALFGGSLTLMRGEVRVELGGDLQHAIPFVARFDRMNGDLVDVRLGADPDPQARSVTLVNAIESAIELNVITAQFQGALRTIPADLTGLAAGAATRVEPGAALALRMTAREPLPPDQAFEPTLRLVDATVKPEAGQVWQAVFDATTSPDLGRTIRVKGFAAMFEPPPGRPDDAAVAVVVEFDGGVAVELGPSKLEAEARIRQSVADLVLRRDATSAYRYRCRVIRRSGQVLSPDWIEDSIDLLFPMLPQG